MQGFSWRRGKGGGGEPTQAQHMSLYVPVGGLLSAVCGRLMPANAHTGQHTNRQTHTDVFKLKRRFASFLISDSLPFLVLYLL